MATKYFSQFVFMYLRFVISEKGEVFLYTIQVPSKFDRHKPTQSLVVKWDCSKWIPQLSRKAGLEPLTQMAVRWVEKEDRKINWE